MNIGNQNKEYKTDGVFIYSCQYHVIFCTKYRRKVLINEIEERLKELIIEKEDEYGYKVIDMETMPDHVHLILDVNPRHDGIYRIVSKIKGLTSRTLRKEFKEVKSKIPTLWTHSRFISSVGAVSLDIVKKYIENQKNA